MSDKKSPYEMSNEDLLLAFQMASSNLGTTSNYWGRNSSAAADARQKVGELLRALHARLDGQKPPFTKGMRVRSKNRRGWTRTVDFVQYIGEKRWFVVFTYESCVRSGPFSCDDYELAPAAATPATNSEHLGTGGLATFETH